MKIHGAISADSAQPSLGRKNLNRLGTPLGSWSAVRIQRIPGKRRKLWRRRFLSGFTSLVLGGCVQLFSSSAVASEKQQDEKVSSFRAVARRLAAAYPSHSGRHSCWRATFPAAGAHRS